MMSTGWSSWWRQMRGAVMGLGLAAGGALLGGAGIGYYVANELTRPARPTPSDEYVFSPFETGADFEDIDFPSERDGRRVRGWWLPRTETNRVIVCCPGYRGNRWQLVGIGTGLWRAGFNVLLFDYPGHGMDLGRRVSLGYREVGDFLGALNYVEQRVSDARVGVLGYSMGGAVAVLGTARRSEVRAIVADSPFARHADVVAQAIQNTLRVPVGPLFASVADVFLPLLAGYRHADVTPIASVAQISPRPLLLIHGTQDETIPVEHAHQLFAEAQEPKELWLGNGAAHCGTYFLDRPTYVQRVTEFFERHLGASTEHTELPVSA